MNFFAAIFSQLFRIFPFVLTPSTSAPAHAPLVAQQFNQRRPIIIDTDMSHDDIIALLYLLQHPAVDIVGITIVNGVACVDDGLENTRRLLAMVGRENVPVAAGPAKPLAGNNSFLTLWRLAAKFGLRLNFSPTKATPAVSAPDLIRRLISTAPGPVQLIALGPLTNIALALQDDPTLPAHIDSIVVSGGSIAALDGRHKHAGSPNKISEWNMWVDPAAADLVFRSGAKLVLVPLDVTHNGASPLLISRRLLAELSAVGRWREAHYVAALLKLSFFGSKHEAIPLWDVPVAALAVEPDIGTDWRDLNVRITTAPPETAGQTIVDETYQATARVCLGGDQTTFEATFMKVFR